MAQYLVIDPNAKNGGKNPAAWNALDAFAKAFYEAIDGKYSIYLYSANDRNHVENSLHYSDSAFDINLWNNIENHIENAKSKAYLSLQSKIKEIAKSFYLNLRDDIIYNGESDNNHLEYVGPKNITNTTSPNYRSTYNICAENENFKKLDPKTQSRIVNAINKASATHGIAISLIIAMITTESQFILDATSPTAGAQGLMQLMPETAKGLGVSDPFNIEQNINAGVQYIKQQLDRFGNLSDALKAYNGGPNRTITYPETALYADSVSKKQNEINQNHPEAQNVASYAIDKNKYDAAAVALGLDTQEQPTSLVYKVKAIDKALFDLRQLYYQKQTIDPKNSQDWNTIEQLAMLFTKEITGIFTKALQSHKNLNGQNLDNEAIKTNFHDDMDYIIRAADTIPHMKNVITLYLKQINDIGNNAQNVLNYIQNIIKNSI